jgi:hypothetical protein
MFTVAELKTIRHFLRELSEKMGDAGCNDFNPKTDIVNPRLTDKEVDEIIALATTDFIPVPSFDFLYVDALVKKIDATLKSLEKSGS